MKPSIPKGTRDFSSTEVAKRNYIFSTIKHAFELFGFQPIETPSFENSDTLMGKYGEEGDRLIFKILNSGDYIGKVDEIDFFNLLNAIRFVYKNILQIIKKNDLKDSYYESKFKDNLFFLLEKKIQNKNHLKEKDLIYKIIDVPFLKEYQNKRNESIDRIVSEFYKENLSKNLNKITSKISEKALRYDLTVPFARYVVQHQNEITFPFKRYQIQPVWRADRPQKGRFREFFQCDADVVGSKSLWQEVEFIQLYDSVFNTLGLQGATIKINNRKILAGIAEVIGAKDKLIAFTVALDKLDKIGKDGVVKEMLAKGITAAAIEKVTPLFDFTGTNSENLTSLENMLQGSEEGLKGVEELRFIVDSIEALGLQSASLTLDVTLARGLNYYTGAIFEVAAPEGVKMGSIGGGGRYDDLTGIFGLKDVSGVGISFGLDRIYLVMEELGLFETVELPQPKVLFLNFNAQESLAKVKAISTLRANGIKSELYPDVATSNKQEKKQFKYADTRAIEFVVSSIEENKFKIKDRNTGVQKVLTINEIITFVK